MSGSWEAFRDSFGTTIDYLQSGYLNSGSPVPTNIAPLDELLCGGWRAGLHIIGGEPAAGKSAFGLFSLMMASLSGTRSLYVSLEMGRGQCLSRCYSYASLTTGRPFRWGDTWMLARDARARRDDALRRGEAMEFAEEFMRSDPYAMAAKSFDERFGSMAVADSEALHEIGGIEQAARRGRASGLECVVVDYLQYIDVEGVTDEYARVSAASKRLNRLGVELGIPVVALASCSRSGNAKGKAPTMHDFKGSGDIEYHALSASIIAKDPQDPRARLLHVVKNRFGGTTEPEQPIVFTFDGAHNSFELPEC